MSADLANWIAYGGLILTASLYSIFLESLKKAYEPNWTWLTVLGGIALTGGFVALRLTLQLPALSGAAMAWWVWGVWFWAFVWSGIPIITWQLWQARKRLWKRIQYMVDRTRYFREETER